MFLAIHEEILTEFHGVNEKVAAVFDGTEDNEPISSSPSLSSLEASEEVESILPRIGELFVKTMMHILE